MKTKKIVLLGILISQALVLSFIERFISIPVPIPGVKLGLANIISLFSIIIFGFREAIVITILRTFLGATLGGGISSFLFSVVGGIFSTSIMFIMYHKYSKYFSIPVISVVGAIFHNIGQLLVASIVVSNWRLFYYLPILMISGVITGIFIGLLTQFTIKPMKKILNI